MQCLKRDILRSPLASEFREEKVGEERNRGEKKIYRKQQGGGIQGIRVHQWYRGEGEPNLSTTQNKIQTMATKF